MKDEEPKQESPEEPTMIDDWLNEYGDPEIYKKVERELESREAARKYTEPKQETLEEAALKWFMTANKREIIFDLGWIKIFEAGACWQEKRMYSEAEQNYLDLIRFLRTQDKMGKSAEDLLEQFKMR